MPGSSQILIVGDLHGNWGRLNALIARHRPEIVLQCGDFGWWPQFEVQHPVLYGNQKRWILRGVKPGSCAVYWCDGNHEQHPVLPRDGGIHELYDGVYYGSRGSTMRLPDGRTVLFAGGASSIDRASRTPGHDWFPEENISQQDLDRMLAHVQVDIVVSHTCPASFPIRKSVGKETDANRIALQAVLEHYEPELWFFGHWHKHDSGVVGKTRWWCLDYPRHGSTWWMRLPEEKG